MEISRAPSHLSGNQRHHVRAAATLRANRLSRPKGRPSWRRATPCSTSIFWVFLALSFPLAASAGGAPCTEIKAVFFDLGDTLVEPGGGGFFILRPGAAETIAQLQAREIRLGIITNVPAGWELADLEAVLQDPSFLDDFEVIVLSSQAPASKPDPAIYTHAHSLLVNGPVIHRVAFVGETLGEIADAEPPTEGARSVGMVGIHLSAASPSPLADYTVAPDDLAAIVSVVESHGQPLFCDDFEIGDTSNWTLEVNE